jgi:small-conductance mechanosensitive channel
VHVREALSENACKANVCDHTFVVVTVVLVVVVVVAVIVVFVVVVVVVVVTADHKSFARQSACEQPPPSVSLQAIQYGPLCKTELVVFIGCCLVYYCWSVIVAVKNNKLTSVTQQPQQHKGPSDKRAK